MTNTRPTNVASSVSTNFDDKKMRCEMDCYFANHFISDPTTIYNRYYFLSLYKT